MFIIGIFAVLGLGILAGNNYLTNASINRASELAALRNKQIKTVNLTMQSHLGLMLTAMESIRDKDEGKIDKEHMEAINANVIFINYKLKSLDELAGTEEEKRLTQDLHTYFEKFSTGIQANLVQLIKNSGLRSTEIEAEYGNIDNLLDEHGDRVDENLAKLEASLQNKLMDASEDDSDYKEKIDTVNYLRMSLLYIKLAVKNSIIDKDEGQVKAENMEIIDMNIDYLSSNLDEIDEMVETEEEKGFVGAVRDALPKLAEVTNVGLVNLIENSAVEAKQIKAAFVKIDDTLNDYGDKLEDNLKKIQVSVQQQGKEADEASERLLTKSKMVGWITFFVTLVIITTALFLISRSIIKPISRTGHNLSESADQDIFCLRAGIYS